MREMERHLMIFNVIAPIYNWFFTRQVRTYRSLIVQNKRLFTIPKAGRVLDLGCGTGALLFCLAEMGYQAVGVDFSLSMLRAAKKSTAGKFIELVHGDVTQGLDFPDKSFDLVLASYVLHGVSSGLRRRFYAEASRLSKGPVLFHDYNKNRRILTDIVEWAERGDYFEFVRHGEDEMRACFQSVERIDVGIQTALYICSPI
ncbi:MAG: class I SAM-dependent methyltransferase [Bacillota bacterium]|nr:class I SAM-dependent methyltransferase [Bacillota bacterium]MDP4160754.1 class I SAM-dependent methyltransferase [Bacillota bacterium]